MINLKPYRYKKGTDPRLDGDFAGAASYGNVWVGQTAIFWQQGLRRYAMPVSEVTRIFRRVEPVFGKLCCGGHSFIMEWLVLILGDGSELVLHIGDDVEKAAQALLETLKQSHPQIQYGKV